MVQLPESTTEDALQLAGEERRTLISMLPPYVKEAAEKIPEQLRYMDEKELRKYVRPNPSVQALRNSFWLEYARCIDKEGQWLKIGNILSGICTIEYWAQVVTKNSGMMEWILRPPISYNKAMEEALYFGVERIREILELPFTYNMIDPRTGKEREVVDSKAAELVLKAFMIIDNRVKGSVLQRSETKSLQVNASMKEVQGVMEGQSMEEIEKKLKDLRKKDAALEANIVEAEVVKASGEEISS